MAGSMKDKIKTFFTGTSGDEYDDEYDENDENDEYDDHDHDDYYQPAIKKNQSIESSSARYSASKVEALNNDTISINAKVSIGVCMFSPSTLDDTANIVDKIKSRNIIIINLEAVDYATSQRISDVICGAAYALESMIQLISDKIMIVAPNDIEISGDLKEKIQASGFQVPNAVWH